MKHLTKGLLVSLLFALVSALLYGLGTFLELDSLWWPIYWPPLVFALPGMPIVYLLDTVPFVNKVFGLIFPKGGASGVFGSVILTAILVWGIVLSVLSKFNKLKVLTWPSKINAV